MTRPVVPDEKLGEFLAEVFGFPPAKARQVLGAFAEEGTDVQVDLTDAELTIEGACGFGLSGELFLERFRSALPILEVALRDHLLLEVREKLLGEETVTAADRAGWQAAIDSEGDQGESGMRDVTLATLIAALDHAFPTQQEVGSDGC